MCAKASLFHDNQEQYAKYECFSDLMSVRSEKARSKQVALCFWCAVPLRTHPPTYDRRSTIRKIYGLVLSTRLEHEVPCNYSCK